MREFRPRLTESEYGMILKYRQNQEKGTFPILALGCTHEPFTHPRYIDFICDVMAEYKPNTVIHLGDFMDNHAISRHISSGKADGAKEEYLKTKTKIKNWVDLLPSNTYYIPGNHCLIPTRQGASLGMPGVFFKTPQQLWDLPDTWKIAEQFIIENIFFEQGVRS